MIIEVMRLVRFGVDLVAIVGQGLAVAPEFRGANHRGELTIVPLEDGPLNYGKAVECQILS